MTLAAVQGSLDQGSGVDLATVESFPKRIECFIRDCKIIGGRNTFLYLNRKIKPPLRR
jgi:hypothetical protein